MLSWQRKRHQHVHVVDRKEARPAAQQALVPVGVDPAGEEDDVTLAEPQLAGVVRLEGVHGTAAGPLQDRLVQDWLPVGWGEGAKRQNEI